MRTLNVVLAAALLVTGIVAVHLWRELRVERTLNASLRAQPAMATAPAPPVTAAGTGAAGTVSPAAAELRAAEVPGVAQPAIAATPPANRPLRVEAQLLKNPEFRKARLAQIRANLASEYPGVVEDLALSPREADALFDLLAERQLDRSAVTQALLDGRPADASVAQQRRQAQAEVDRRFDAALGALLGAARQEQWQGYQARRGAYQQAEQVTTVLARAGQPPLTAEQTRALRAAYVAADQARRETPLDAAAGGDRAQRMAQSLKLQTARNAAILEAAERSLSPAQVEAMRAAFAREIDAANAQIQMMELRARAQRETGAVQP